MGGPLTGTMRDVIERGPVPAPGDPIPLDQVRLRVPVADPSKIISAPVNYLDHQAEMSVDALGIFLKAPSSLLDPGGAIQLPYHDRRFDQEGELALAIGRTVRNVSEREALSAVFGYTGLLDITMRGGEDRSTRKSFDTFTPTSSATRTMWSCAAGSTTSSARRSTPGS